MKNLLIVGAVICLTALFSFSKPLTGQESDGIYAQSTGPHYFTIRILPSNGQAMETRDGGASWHLLSVDKAEKIKLQCAQLDNVQPFLYADAQSDFIIEKESAPVTSANIGTSSVYPSSSGGQTVLYHLPGAGNVTISVFTETGSKVADISQGYISAGNHSASLNMPNMPSGIYFYRIVENGTQVSMGKILSSR